MIGFIIDNWAEIVAVIVAVDVLANKIVKVTKSQKDDAILAAIDKVIGFFRR
jgi:hypothetical protein